MSKLSPHSQPNGPICDNKHLNNTENHIRMSTDIICMRYSSLGDLTKGGTWVNGNAQQNCMPICYENAISNKMALAFAQMLYEI